MRKNSEQKRSKSSRWIFAPVHLAWMLALGLSCSAARAADPVIDCPLRDVPYSVETPIMDILLNPEAKAVVERHVPVIFKSLPPSMLSTEAPSLSAIMSVRSMTGMLRLPAESPDLDSLNKELQAVEITKEDKRSRCARYDNEVPILEFGDEARQILVFDKVNGFDHGPAVEAATDAIRGLAGEKGWGVTVTDKAGVFTPEILSKFDTVVWNNVSGDVLTLSQRQAFKEYIEQGGGFLGIHGSGGDFIYLWDWYVDTLLGAQFIGHTMAPHYQDAKVVIEDVPSGIAGELAPGWTMNDEWYSFAESPRSKGASIVATLDETSYLPEMSGQSLRMGEDHPIAWGKCVGDGRSFYSGIGHRPEVYGVEENLGLLKDALVWTAGEGRTLCKSDREVE